MVYSDKIEDKIDLIKEELKKKYPDITNHRWVALKLLEQDKEITETYPVDLPDVLDRSYETDIINQKYDFIEEIVEEVVVNKAKKEELTDRVDKALTHRIWGIPIFLCIMALVFLLTFTVGDWLKGYVELLMEVFSGGVRSLMESVGVAPLLISLVTDGVIAGVGGMLTFLPNIFILFLALAFLEDSGYMARVAYVMDGIMGRLGLSGRAFIPMILGFGCTVPALMASRVLESRKDRYRVMLITPFMSCSARLPIYILFSEMFFGRYAMLAAYSMYVIGLGVAILVAFLLHKKDQGTAQQQDRCHLRLGKGKGLPHKGRNDDLFGFHCDVVLAEHRSWWAGRHDGGKLRGDAWKICDAVLCSAGAWILADRHGAHRRNFRKGSGGDQLCGAFWHFQYQFGSRDGKPDGNLGRNGLRGAQCLQPDGFLTALHSLRGDPRNHQKGDGRLEMGRKGSHFSAGSGMGRGVSDLPDRQPDPWINKATLQRCPV